MFRRQRQQQQQPQHFLWQRLLLPTALCVVWLLFLVAVGRSSHAFSPVLTTTRRSTTISSNRIFPATTTATSILLFSSRSNDHPPRSSRSSSSRSTSSSRPSRQRRQPSVQDDDAYYDEIVEAPVKQRSKEPEKNDARMYYDDDDDDDDDEYDVDDAYMDEDEYYYDDDDTNILQPDIIEWERCVTTDAGIAHVLLPPPSVTRPTAIVHFIGGTFFGSAPSIWYQSLLEELVLHTQCAIIATSIPVTVLSSPLQHVPLAKQCRTQFQTAYRDILLDEYGPETVQNIPVCACGHSLGARLLTVLTTLQPPSNNVNNNNKKKKQHPWQPNPYKSMILMSFTNYGAAAGIPGIYQLSQSSKSLEQQQAVVNAANVAREQERKSRNNRTNNRRRQRQQQQQQQQYYDDFDDYDDDDDSWDSVLTELQDLIRTSTVKVQSALTPSSSALEFHPSPAQLWKAIRQDGRYQIPQTLLIQFDNDAVDQSSQLAQALLDANSNSTTTTTTTDLKFARLRGTHLTPVSIEPAQTQRRSTSTITSNSSTRDRWLQRINNKAGQVVVQWLAVGKQSRKSNEQQAFLELRQSIARYITDVVTKE